MEGSAYSPDSYSPTVASLNGSLTVSLPAKSSPKNEPWSNDRATVSSQAEERQDEKKPSRRDVYKYPFDVSILLFSFILGFPLWLLAWTLIPLAIWLSDRGPIFYSQERVGKNKRVFRVVKFRTMVVDAEKHTGPVWASAKDPRITGVGRVLRRTHLDELPQVISVFRGEMSLVGPRPERPNLTKQFAEEIPNFESRLDVRPGIAGLAQVRGRYNTHPRNKLRYDIVYIKNLSPWMDIKLFAQSLWVAFFPKRKSQTAAPLPRRRMHPPIQV